MDVYTRTLDCVFGPDSVGATPMERAQSSTRFFVRSQDHLGIDRPDVTGLRMTPEEALRAFGFRFLIYAVDNGTAIIICDAEEPARSIRTCRTGLRLSQEELAERAGLTVEQIRDAEDHSTRTPMCAVLVPVCRVLGLNPHTLGLFPQ